MTSTEAAPPVLEASSAVTAVPTKPSRSPARTTLAKAAVMLVLSAITLAFIYPFVWLLSASFKPRGDVFDNRLIPKTFTFDNYLQVWHEAPMALWLLNTVIVTVLATVTVTVSSALVAWGFAHFRFRGRDLLFGLVLASMMIPGAVTMIPTYLIWHSLGLTGTLVPLWAQNLFGSAFYIFLLRQFFLRLLHDLFDVVNLYCANNCLMIRLILLPLTKLAF